MPESCFRRKFDVAAERISKLAQRAGREFRVEDIHDLRVEIKRLRALLGLVKAVAPRFKSRGPSKPFRKLFKSAAGLREAQVASGLAREWSAATALHLDAYRNTLKRNEREGRKVFAVEARRFRHGFSRRKSRPVDEAVGKHESGELARLTRERTQRLLTRLLESKKPRPAKRDLHRIRVRAKKTRYTLEILQECFRPDEARLERLNRALRAVHQALGRWHDLELAAASLRDFLEGPAGRPSEDPRASAAYGRYLVAERKKRLAEFERSWLRLVRLARA